MFSFFNFNLWVRYELQIVENAYPKSINSLHECMNQGRQSKEQLTFEWALCAQLLKIGEATLGSILERAWRYHHLKHLEVFLEGRCNISFNSHYTKMARS